MQERPADHDPVLKLIHAAILGGTLVFFSVAFFMFGGRETEVSSPWLRWAWLAVAAGAVFAVGALRGRMTRTSDPMQARTSAIAIWAVAEAAALVGIVTTIVTGDVAPAVGATLIGVFLMLHHRPSRLG